MTEGREGNMEIISNDVGVTTANGTDTDVVAVADAVCTVYKTMVIMEGREGTLEISSNYANAVIRADATMVHNAENKLLLLMLSVQDKDDDGG